MTFSMARAIFRSPDFTSLLSVTNDKPSGAAQSNKQKYPGNRWGIFLSNRPVICSSSSPEDDFPTMRQGYVYILASKRNGTLYTGVTSDRPRRLLEHQNSLTPGFTSRYSVKTLVWFEVHDLVTDAIMREKTIKKWPRQWKLDLIEAMNSDWEDISHFLMSS